jgi:hypothetical protein
MEAKEDYKKRTGLPSPDEADTLALTFGINIARRDSNLNRNRMGDASAAITEYEPLEY